MSTPLDTVSIQRFDDLYEPTPSATVSLASALESVHTGVYRRAILHVRQILARQGPDAYRPAKDRLPQWTFAGTFAPTRAKDSLMQHSGVCHADIDHLCNLATTAARLRHDPCVVYCFTSPSGEGLKYGVRIAQVPDDDAYKHAWATLAALHRTTYGVTWDPSGKDICRLCFVSWDPDCYVNLAAEVASIPPPMVIPPRPSRPWTAPPLSQDHLSRAVQWALARADRLIRESQPGHQHDARRRAAYLLGGYIGGGLVTLGEARAVLQDAVEATAEKINVAMKTIDDGLLKGQAKPITEAHLHADWEAWKAAHPLPTRTVPDMTRPLAHRLSITLPTTLPRRLFV